MWLDYDLGRVPIRIRASRRLTLLLLARPDSSFAQRGPTRPDEPRASTTLDDSVDD